MRGRPVYKYQETHLRSSLTCCAASFASGGAISRTLYRTRAEGLVSEKSREEMNGLTAQKKGPEQPGPKLWELKQM